MGPAWVLSEFWESLIWTGPVRWQALLSILACALRAIRGLCPRSQADPVEAAIGHQHGLEPDRSCRERCGAGGWGLGG